VLRKCGSEWPKAPSPPQKPSGSQAVSIAPVPPELSSTVDTISSTARHPEAIDKPKNVRVTGPSQVRGNRVWDGRSSQLNLLLWRE